VLGLRRYRTVQIDIWQGHASQFAADCLVSFEVEDSPQIALKNMDSSAAATTILRASLPSSTNWNAYDWESLFLKIFELAERSGLRHLVVPGRPMCFPDDVGSDAFAKAGFRSLHQWLDSKCSIKLGRVTFVADNADGYHILQEHLFAEYADELDDEGF
jgi:hypothetical protein